MNAKQIWQSAQERIQPKISQAIFNTWFNGTSGVSLKGHLLTVHVPTTFSRAHLETRFHDLICSVLTDLIGPDVEVCFEVGQAEERAETAARGPLPQQGTEDAQIEMLEPALEEISAPEAARPQRQPALMTVAAARRDRVEAAQEGRRLPRRALPYAGPELLPIAEAPVATPLLAAITSSAGGRDGETGAPAWRDQRSGDEHIVTTTVVESARPLALASAEEERAPQAPKVEPRAALVPWSRPLPARGSGAAENSNEGMLNRRYTFDTFIVGRSNELAHAASQGIAEQSAESYNPLLIYGGVGLGKTHLLHAIGHCGLAAGLNILYTTADRFTNEIINAIRFHTTEEFRAKYRQIDILLVDDIQFIAGKESTEEEFFHTFNALHNANKQIVLTSDRLPREMVTLQDRLRSRFEWGLMADIQLPDYEHRLAILRSKTEIFSWPDGLQMEVPDDVIEYLAAPDGVNVRELEGKLNRVIANAHLRREPITVKLAAAALQQLLIDSKPIVLNPAQVLEVVARHYNVTLEALRGQQRNREIAWPRQVAMFLMRQETKATSIQIAAELGGRDHSTVLHGAKHVKEAIKDHERVRKELAIVREELRILASQQEAFEE